MNIQTRRSCLTGLVASGVATAMAVPGLATAKTKVKAGACVIPPIDRASFERYAKLFSAYDPAFLEYYAPDAVLDIGSRSAPLVGREAIWNHFGRLRQNFTEKMEPLWFVGDYNGIAVEMNGSYHCFKDAPNSPIFGRSIKAGETRHIRGIILYSIENGKFKHVRGPKPETLQDWSMES